MSWVVYLSLFISVFSYLCYRCYLCGSYSKERLHKLENKIIAKYSTSTVPISHDQRIVKTSSGNWEVHSLIVIGSRSSRGLKPAFLYIHGVLSCALANIESFNALSEHYDIYVMDVPGFGRTESPNITTVADIPKIMAIYSDFINAYIDSFQLKKVHLVGHSFGGFISIRFASDYPDRVEKMILTDFPGTLPTSGALGFYWALFFKYRPIFRICRFFGRFLVGLFRSITSDPWIDYYISLYAQQTATGDDYVARCITITGTKSWWNFPVLPSILRLKVPLALIWGEKDSLTIPEHGKLLVALSGSAGLHCYMVKDAFHNTVFTNNGTDYTECLLRAFENAVKMGEDAERVAQQLDKKDLWFDHKTFDWVKSTPNTRATERSVQLFENYIMTHANGRPSLGQIHLIG